MPSTKQKLIKRSRVAVNFGPALTAIRKVVAPGLTATAASQVLIDKLILSFLKRLATKSDSLAHYANKRTLKGAHTGTAADLLLIGPMSGQSAEFAAAAWQKFTDSNATVAAQKQADKEAIAASTTEVEAS